MRKRCQKVSHHKITFLVFIFTSRIYEYHETNIMRVIYYSALASIFFFIFLNNSMWESESSWKIKNDISNLLINSTLFAFFCYDVATFVSFDSMFHFVLFTRELLVVNVWSFNRANLILKFSRHFTIFMRGLISVTIKFESLCKSSHNLVQLSRIML